MPSDAKKKQAQKKKEAAKARQSGKKPTTNNAKSAQNGEGDKESSPSLNEVNGSVNGSTDVSVEG